MKVISKYLKVALCFLAFAVLGFVFAINPSVSAYGALSHAEEAVLTALKAVKIPSVVDATADEEFLIPQLNGASNYVVRVFDPAGQTHDYNVGGTNTDAYFTLTAENKIKVNTLNNGTYKVVYIVNGVYSNAYRVQVKNVSYSLNFVKNNVNALVKPTIALLEENEDTSDEKKWVKLPTATVNKIVDGEEVETAYLPTIETTFSGEEITATNYETLAAAKTAIKESTTPVQFINITTGDDAGLYVLPTVEGKFAVTYSYNAGANRPSKTYTINVVEDFEEPTELTIATPTLPSFELGDTDIELPKLTVSNKYSENIAYNITKVRIENESNPSAYIELKDNDLTFDLTLEAFAREGYTPTDYKDLSGNYKVTYYIVDAYGIEKDVTYKKEKVTINSNPTVYMAYNYTVEEVEGKNVVDESKVDTSFEADLKREYHYTNIVVPAAYAEDKVSTYNDLAIVRTLVDASTRDIYYIDNVKYENGAIVPIDEEKDNKNYALADDYKADVSKAVAFKFAATESEEDDFAGKTFILRYQVYSKNVKSRNGRLVSPTTASEYTFKVVDEFEQSTPEVKITNLSSLVSAKQDEEITVKVSANDNKDTRLTTRVFAVEGSVNKADAQDKIQKAVRATLDADDYVIGNSNILDDANFITAIQKDYATFAKVEAADANTFKFAATKNSTIIAVTVNDNGTIAIATRTIAIKNTTEEVAPEYSVVSAGSFAKGNVDKIHALTANIGDTIELPTIAFADTEDNSLAVNVVYYIGETPETKAGIQYLTPSNYLLIGNTISGGEIFASKAGTYNIIYTATDDAGNTTVVTYSFEVEEVKKPVISVDVTGEDVEYLDGVVTAKSGAIIKLDSSEINYGYATTVQIMNGGLYYEALGDNEYQFFGAGTYTVKFNAGVGEDKAEEKIIKIKVEAVELKWEDSFATIPEYAKVNETVFLPLATTNDGAKIDVKVTLGKEGKEVKTTYVNDGWTFVPEKNGVYYVTYTAENENYVLDDSKSEFTINVGDNVEPKLTVSKKTELSKDIVFDGSNDVEYKVAIDTSSKTLIVKIINNGKTTTINTGLSVTDKNDAGTMDNNTSALWRSVKAELISDSGIIEPGEANQWFINGTGKVTLKITAEDKYEKVGETVINFNVVRKTDAKDNNDTVVGTIMVVIASVILVGAVAYFVFAGKKGGKPKSKRNKIVEVETEVDEVEEAVEVKTEEVKEENNETVEEAKVAEETVEEKVEETETNAEETKTEETDSEAKSGDVE